LALRPDHARAHTVPGDRPVPLAVGVSTEFAIGRKVVAMSEKTSWHVTLLGGFKRDGRWRMPANTVVLTSIGGVDLDLSEADLSTADPVVTKVSLVGGVKVTVPPGVDVDVTNISLFGGRNVQTQAGESAQARIHIRSYGIVGGVKVRTSA
jgi:hypothetical protein